MTLPEVFAYVDHRAFLRDWFHAKKTLDPEYSYAAFARDGGCSKSALANAISTTRTPRAATVDAFARAMDLSPNERNYLGRLVDLDKARTTEERVAIMNQLLENKHYGQLRDAEVETSEAIHHYLEHWWIPAIRELAKHPSFRPDPRWIAETMMPPITEQQARDALDVLERHDFIERQEDGTVQVLELRFASGPRTTQRAIADFHQTQVPAMLENLLLHESAERQVSTATLSLPPELVTQLKLELHNVIVKAGNLADAHSDTSSTRVYQLSLQMLPLTRPLEDPDPSP